MPTINATIAKLQTDRQTEQILTEKSKKITRKKLLLESVIDQSFSMIKHYSSTSYHK